MSSQDGKITGHEGAQITGYRYLTQQETDLVNEGKALAILVGKYVDKLQDAQDTDKRWVAIGRTDAQTAFMALTRSIAQPTTF